jgi:hypothetical protein
MCDKIDARTEYTAICLEKPQRRTVRWKSIAVDKGSVSFIFKGSPDDGHKGCSKHVE